jgi:hypothetical protein
MFTLRGQILVAILAPTTSKIKVLAGKPRDGAIPLRADAPNCQECPWSHYERSGCSIKGSDDRGKRRRRSSPGCGTPSGPPRASGGPLKATFHEDVFVLGKLGKLDLDKAKSLI